MALLSATSRNVEQTEQQTVANVLLKISPGCSRELHAEHPRVLSLREIKLWASSSLLLKINWHGRVISALGNRKTFGKLYSEMRPNVLTYPFLETHWLVHCHDSGLSKDSQQYYQQVWWNDGEQGRHQGGTRGGTGHPLKFDWTTHFKHTVLYSLHESCTKLAVCIICSSSMHGKSKNNICSLSMTSGFFSTSVLMNATLKKSLFAFSCWGSNKCLTPIHRW